MILGEFKIGMKLHRQTSRVMSWFLAPLHCHYMNQHNLVLDHASPKVLQCATHSIESLNEN